jgi:hypothetical protein
MWLYQMLPYVWDTHEPVRNLRDIESNQGFSHWIEPSHVVVPAAFVYHASEMLKNKMKLLVSHWIELSHVVVSNTFMYRQFANASEIPEMWENTADLYHWIGLPHVVVSATFVHCQYVSPKKTLSKWKEDDQSLSLDQDFLMSWHYRLSHVLNKPTPVRWIVCSIGIPLDRAFSGGGIRESYISNRSSCLWDTRMSILVSHWIESSTCCGIGGLGMLEICWCQWDTFRLWKIAPSLSMDWILHMWWYRDFESESRLDVEEI